MFANQQPFGWAIIESEALAQIRSLGIEIPSKIITFSSSNRRADISLDRGLIVSRVPGWEGPLLDFNECQLQGAHNAEIIMAALAVGRVLRIPLEQSEEHTSELQSRRNLVCRLLLEKKKYFHHPIMRRLRSALRHDVAVVVWRAAARA